MLRSIIGPFLFCLLTLTAAHAQTAVYVEAGLAAYGFTHPSSNDIGYKKNAAGLTAGVFYNFPIQSRVTVGVDGRLAYSPGDNGGTLGGGALRVGFVPVHNPLRPYLQIGGGVVHSSYNDVVSISNGFSTSTYVVSQSVTNGAAQFLVGLDIRLTDHVDLRAPEYGAQAGGGDGRHAVTAFLNVGLVYHLRPKPQP